jgi:hypothetical protein
MDSILRNELQKLEFVDPEEALKVSAFFHVFSSPIRSGEKLRDWRVHKLENYRENEQVALFAYGLKKSGLKTDLKYAHYRRKDRDFDGAVCWGRPGALEFATVQLKEVVREELNLRASLENEIVKFQRYDGSDELIGAIFVNRNLSFDFTAIKVPPLRLRELWIFGFSVENGPVYWLFGDFINQARVYQLPVPALRWENEEDLPGRKPSDH